MEAHDAGRRQDRNRFRQKGGALLWIILVVIVVVGVVTIGQKFLGWGSPGDPEDCPWLEEDRIVDIGGTVTLPAPPKTDLRNWNTFQVNPVYEGEERGTLQVEITDAGHLLGTWKADYVVDNTSFTFSAGFGGNIDVTKTYTDEFGNEDPSLLYIIAKGTFTKQVYNKKTTRGGAGGGKSYLTGWLGPDGKGRGKIVLTFDKKNTQILTWQR